MILELDIAPIKIGSTLITLEDKGEGKGKIKVYDPKMGSYEMYWGSMGSDLKEFLCRINSCYFSDKLLGYSSGQVFDVNGTFRNLRKFIREEIGLQWYHHMEFQKQLREVIRDFQDNCKEFESEKYFIDSFSFHLSTMPDFYLIENRFERDEIESVFNNISEPWNFIETKGSKELKWLKMLHGKLKKKLENEKNY